MRPIYLDLVSQGLPKVSECYGYISDCKLPYTYFVISVTGNF